VLAGRGRDGVLISSDCKGIVAAWSMRRTSNSFAAGAWQTGAATAGQSAADIDESSIVYSIQVEHKPGLSGVRSQLRRTARRSKG